jgi:hypothetical protein
MGSGGGGFAPWTQGSRDRLVAEPGEGEELEGLTALLAPEEPGPPSGGARGG